MGLPATAVVRLIGAFHARSPALRCAALCAGRPDYGPGRRACQGSARPDAPSVSGAAPSARRRGRSVLRGDKILPRREKNKIGVDRLWSRCYSTRRSINSRTQRRLRFGSSPSMNRPALFGARPRTQSWCLQTLHFPRRGPAGPQMDPRPGARPNIWWGGDLVDITQAPFSAVSPANPPFSRALPRLQFSTSVENVLKR